MARLDAWFVVTKILVCLASLPLMFARPDIIPHLIAANIVVAVAEASVHAQYLSAAVGTLLAAWCWTGLVPIGPFQPDGDDDDRDRSRTRLVVLFMCAYVVWNVHFNHVFRVGPWTSIPQNMLPLLAALLALTFGSGSSSNGLWVFALSRAVCILVLCLHLCDPRSCHRTA